MTSVYPEGSPVAGPCTSWITADQVADCCGSEAGSDSSIFQDAADAASSLLFELSGRQWNGVCEQTVRPCADNCGCWQWLTSPASPGVPQVPAFSWSWAYWGGYGWGWGYGGGGNDTVESMCGCGSLSRVLLPGYPVVSITEVQINGDVLDASEYRLDGWKWLTRMADADGNAQFWPACQRLDRPLGDDGTWGVTYEFGVAPPLLGEMAAAQLACELYRACAGQDCKLPVGATRVTRQGITVERAPFLSWALMNGQWATGIALVDAFLSAYNPQGLRRPPSVWSPDLAPYATRLGTGSGD